MYVFIKWNARHNLMVRCYISYTGVFIVSVIYIIYTFENDTVNIDIHKDYDNECIVYTYNIIALCFVKLTIMLY